MKFAKLFVVAAVAFSGALTLADGPQIEPGPVQKLEDSASEAIDVMLMAKHEDLVLFVQRGNTTKEVTRQNLEPGVTIYSFTRQQCMIGGFAAGACLGGAQLQVIVTEKREGSNVKIEATSRVNLIK
jgi:hypothetical protein